MSKLSLILAESSLELVPKEIQNVLLDELKHLAAKEFVRENIFEVEREKLLEKMYEISKGHSWLQLYIFQDENFVKDLLDRAKDTGYKVLILTVDVAILSRRARDEKNGFSMPFKIGPRQFLDFATHPKWSLTTLLSGIPKPMNYLTSKNSKQVFDNW